LLIKFNPHYTITSKIANCLMRVEAIKERVLHLPLTAKVLASLRETARLHTTHYSTMIEGNQLDPSEIEVVLKHEGHFPGRVRDEIEVKGYYAALQEVEKWASKGAPLTELMIQTLHALIMSNGAIKVKPSHFRNGQNVIRESSTGEIVYMPPESKDVEGLIKELIVWVKENEELPFPIQAGIVHYQFATIHPYYDGNGRTARLLTTFILHKGGYSLKGLYSLEEYYAKNLGAYYQAISLGPSHNYYFGRAETDITPWLEYFIEGMTFSFEQVLKNMDDGKNRGEKDQSLILRKLDPKQRKALDLFQEFETVNSQQIGSLFGFKPRTNAHLCKAWVEEGFLEIADVSKKGRKYRLAKSYLKLIS
jgi:Fic family protein